LRSNTLGNAANALRNDLYNASIFAGHEFIPQLEPVNTEGETLILPSADKPIPQNSPPRPTRDRPKHASPFDVRRPQTLPATSVTWLEEGQAALATSSGVLRKILKKAGLNSLLRQSENRT
jgi:hypothetical protein